MKHPHFLTDTSLSERDAAWFEELAGTVARGREALFACQEPDGHWLGERDDDQNLGAELVLLLAFLGRVDDPRVPFAANYLLKHQHATGSWGDVGTSVRAYFALKIAGHAEDEPHMRRAIDAVRALGGAEASDSLTRFYLAMLGQLPYSACPSVPVEAVLLPKWLRGISAMPVWERPMRVALGVIRAHEPATTLPESTQVHELFVRSPEMRSERRGFGPIRRRAVRAAANWIRARYSIDGPSTSFRALALNAAVLKCLGVPAEDSEMRWVLKQLEALCVTTGDQLRVRPYESPVRDTALSLSATSSVGAASSSARGESAAQWLLDFETRNAGFTSTESTALTLVALARSGHALRETCSGAVCRAIDFLLAMQNRDGGWSAFDRGLKADPSCPALTACVLEALSHFGFRTGQPPVDRAVTFLLGYQEVSGNWRTRWGTNPLATTGQVLVGLHATGFDTFAIPMRRAVRWVKESQNADGSWGDATASETAWALLALLAANEGESAEVRAGAEFLVGTQHADGAWTEDAFTGADFAPGSKLKSELYPMCFPVMALDRYLTDRTRPAEIPKVLTRTDLGHQTNGPKVYRHTLAEM